MALSGFTGCLTTLSDDEFPTPRDTEVSSTASGPESYSSVTTGRRPSTWDAKAYFTAEETRNLELPFGEPSPFSAGRMSMVLSPRLDETDVNENEIDCER